MGCSQGCREIRVDALSGRGSCRKALYTSPRVSAHRWVPLMARAGLGSTPVPQLQSILSVRGLWVSQTGISVLHPGSRLAANLVPVPGAQLMLKTALTFSNGLLSEQPLGLCIT